MKKHIFAALIALALAPCASIKAETSYSLFVNTVEGQTVEYAFEYLPIATFEGDEMIISDDRNVKGTRFAMDNVVNMTFKADSGTSAVGEVAEAGHIKVAVAGDLLTVSGLEAGSGLTVYDAAGKIVASVNADEYGTAELNIGNLGKGVFVAAMSNYSFKFIR
ncbi:MAG: hypothetical protein K2L00_07755 [Muribaculaceae bacterium]|nr:hypothetical protein [Muribaculaceae bacterium]